MPGYTARRAWRFSWRSSRRPAEASAPDGLPTPWSRACGYVFENFGERVESSSRRSRRRQRADRDDGPPPEPKGRTVMTTQTAVTGPSRACSPAQRVTRSLLGYGVLAGTVFEASILIQGLTRHGFRLAHHDASLLSNGPLGWIQIATFLVIRRDDDRVRRGDAARAGRPGGRHLGAAADRGLRRRADGRRAAARRSGRRFRPGGARGKGGARQLARGRAPDLGEHRVHRPDRGVLRRGPLLQPGAAPWPGHLLARQRPGLPGRVRGRHHRIQLPAPSCCRSTPACSSPGSGSR